MFNCSIAQIFKCSNVKCQISIRLNFRRSVPPWIQSSSGHFYISTMHHLYIDALHMAGFVLNGFFALNFVTFFETFVLIMNTFCIETIDRQGREMFEIPMFGIPMFIIPIEKYVHKKLVLPSPASMIDHSYQLKQVSQRKKCS